MMAVIALGISVGWAFRTRTLASPADPPQFDQRVLFLGTQLETLDPLLNGGTIVVQWSVDRDSCIDDVPDQNDLSGCPPVNLYMDPTMFAGPGNTPSSGGNNSVPDQAIFQFIPEEMNDAHANLQIFETDLTIGTRSDRLADTLLNYPFDRYTAELWIFALVNGTQDPVSLAIDWAGGVAFGFDTEIVGINSDADAGSLDVLIDIKRTVLVRAYVVTIVIAMWLITLLLLVISIKAVFFRCEVDTTILAAPVATLFAFTTLRTAMPGSPSGFGAIIDFVGTLPALATLIAITVLCLLHVLLRSKRLESAHCAQTTAATPA
ncbi:hypothetical protein PsYK624_078770 [Phanerochaete sordida]|uniref:DUF4436 domain-containing protein n=1 Tax=Phanerochaete sordida TaxID=48140 RepID=A0A9P3GBH6_9APHY|nr:hypothetical protein PsYK624_078770 [Phanerochaete sordida]